ncbi:hypothetical protein CLOBOL_04013 [Enterocloster bolteae ATCC BAA-613]|uniref:Uncharacterized protein n=1 Tax=Enterocloster bolteae (strain ATCC BAA-613 / DSM 15670 / CCUG 46953 / JCM 12243 / WAL 16351) TaxID=411902 RepID=A8RUG7_ENTBW|nr:hypothetical protein CLOBOL_04013 [Enterocloster bolteae ATCC BAA-613]
MHYYLKSAIIECVLGEGRFSENCANIAIRFAFLWGI